MFLTLKFPGVLLRTCHAFHEDQLLLSVQRQGIFMQSAVARSEMYVWKMQEKGFIKSVIQVLDVNAKQLLGEVITTNSQTIREAFGRRHQKLRSFIINNNHYVLSGKQHVPSQYVWLDSRGEEVIKYDLTNLEKTIFSVSLKRDGTATIPDDPTYEHLTLFTLGLFLLLLRISVLSTGIE